MKSDYFRVLRYNLRTYQEEPLGQERENNKIQNFFELTNSKNSNTLKIIPIGGLGEIGKNTMAIIYGDDILLVDAGLAFPR